MAGNFEELHCRQECYNLKKYIKEFVLKELTKTK